MAKLKTKQAVILAIVAVLILSCLLVIKIKRKPKVPDIWETMVKDFQGIIKDKPRSEEAAEAQISIARIYNSRLKDYKKAFTEYDKVLDIYPDSSEVPRAFAEMSDLHRFRLREEDLKKPYQKAIKKFTKIIADYPEDETKRQALFSLAYAYDIIEDERSLKTFQKIISNYPGSHWARMAKHFVEYKGASFLVALEVWNETCYWSRDRDIYPGTIVNKEVSTAVVIYPHSPSKEPFPCKLTINTTKEVEKARPEAPIRILPDGRRQAEWQRNLESTTSLGTYKMNHYKLSYTTDARIEEVTILREAKKIDGERQIITIKVIAPFKATLRINVFTGKGVSIDSQSINPRPKWHTQDIIVFPDTDCTREQTFSFIVNLPENIEYYYPDVLMWPKKKRESKAYPKKRLKSYQGTSADITYELTSNRFFEINELKERTSVTYKLNGFVTYK